MEIQELKQGVLFRAKNSKIIRAFVYPYMNHKRIKGRSEYSKTADAAYIRSLKDTKKGMRCFILGNGPSLIPSDLELLKDEDTFAFNRIWNITF